MSLPERQARLLLLAAIALQAGWAAPSDSVTVEELCHVPVGDPRLRTGDVSPDPPNLPATRVYEFEACDTAGDGATGATSERLS